MPRLLRDILCVMETFHNYAQEDDNQSTLTCRELKQLIQGEFGDILQPSVIHAVERNLDLLELDSNGTVSFEEFLLAIFNLLNLCYLDIQSILSSESRPEENTEEKPDGGDPQATRTTDHLTEGTLSTPQEGLSPPGTARPAQLNQEGTGVTELNRENPRGDTETLGMPGGASGHGNSQKELLGGDEQSPREAGGELATGDSEADAPAGAKQACHVTEQTGQDKEMVEEKAKRTREQRGTELRARAGGNLGTSPPKGATPAPSEKQEIATEKQELEREGKLASERADLPGQTASQKLFQMQNPASAEQASSLVETQKTGEDKVRTPAKIKSSAEPEDGRTAKLQDSPAQDKDETKGPNVQGSGKNVSGRLTVGVKRKEEKAPEALREVGQEESVRASQATPPEDRTQAEKHQELQMPSKHRDIDGPQTPESALKAEDQNNPETKEIGHAKEGIARALATGKSNLEEGGQTLEAREKMQESAPLSGQESEDAGKTQDKLLTGEASEQVQDPEPTVPQSEKAKEEASSGGPKSWTLDGASSSEANDTPVQRQSQSEAGLFGESAQGSLDDAQTREALGEDGTALEAVALVVMEGKTQLPEDQEQTPQREPGSQAKGPGPATEPREHLEAHKSTAEVENSKLHETEAPSAQVEDSSDSNQLSVTQLPAKTEDSRKEVKLQNPHPKAEEGGAPETQEAPVTSLDEDSSVSKMSPATGPATSEEEDPRELVEEGDSPQIPTKKDPDTSVSQSDLQEKTQKGEETFSVEREAVYSNPLYTYLQEKMGKQTDKTQEERQQQEQRGSQSAPESCNRPSASSLTSDSQASQQSGEGLVPGNTPAETEQTSGAPQVLGEELISPQKEHPVLQRKKPNTKQ